MKEADKPLVSTKSRSGNFLTVYRAEQGTQRSEEEVEGTTLQSMLKSPRDPCSTYRGESARAG